MKITITGVDDMVDPLDLCRLSAEFPFVEWGILFSVKRFGAKRYPSKDWMVRFGRIAFPGMRMSLHLCGQAARETASGEGHWVMSVPMPVQRVQLNGYEPGSAEGLKAIAVLSGLEFILQARDRAALVACAADAESIKGASVLYDPSGGRGIGTQGWPIPPEDARVGYAGGIGPDNIENTLSTVMPIGAAWIDMESGVRDENDDFDIGRVRHVLELAARIVA